MAGGFNLYGYAGGDPINHSDPFGLCPPKWLCALANASAGFGDAITFGLTDHIRDAIDANGVIDKGSGAYLAGELSGAAASIALGSATAGAIREGATLATSGPVRAVASRALGSPVGRALFGKGGSANSGQTVRVGVSRASDGGRYVFRAAGGAVERAAGAKKIDIIDLGKIEDYLRASGAKP